MPLMLDVVLSLRVWCKGKICQYRKVTWFSYITETWQSWAGPIEKATFCVENNLFEYFLRKSSYYPLGDPADMPPDEKIPDEAIEHGFGMKFGSIFPAISPDGWQRSYIPEVPKPNDEPNGILWKYENYKPGKPLVFKYYFLGFPEKASDCETWVRFVLGRNPTKANLLELREITAAYFGVEPQTASVKRFVEKQIWYKPEGKKSESDLPASRRAVLAELKRMAERQCDASNSKIPANSSPKNASG